MEGATIELFDAVATRGARIGRCRLCARETVDDTETLAGRVFADEAEVEAALARWARAEGDPDVHGFVAANFGGRTVTAVAQCVRRGERVETSFDVVAWLFKDRVGGQSVVGGGSPPGNAHGPAGAVEGVRHLDVPLARAEPAGRRLATVGAATVPDLAPSPADDADPHATTIALVTVAMADGTVPDRERATVLLECKKLGAPEPLEGEWRLWRPGEVGTPVDPVATVAAMRRVGLVNRLPDPSAERVIREFARHWRVAVPQVLLPPVTPGQKLARQWLDFFGR